MTCPVRHIDPSGRDLYGEFGWLRAAGPAVPVALPEGVTAWSVTDAEVLKWLMTDPRVSKNPENWTGYEPGLVRWLAAWVDVRSMLTADGEDHARLAQLIKPVLTPRAVAALTPAVEELTADLLHDLKTTEPGTVVDLRDRYAYRIPTRVICDLMGVPDRLRPRALAVMDGVMDSAADQQWVQRELPAAMGAVLDARRAELDALTGRGEPVPADLTARLLTLRDRNGEPLTEEERISSLILLIGAGSQTAVALIDHALHALLERPDVLADVIEHDRWDEVITETLRLHPPIAHMPLYYATADIDLGEGVTIPAGEAILPGFGAHGRDPAVHTDADAWDINRPTAAQHLAFGHGTHYCIGAHLARLKARTALRALLTAAPGLRLAEEPQRAPSFIGNDVVSLPVIWPATTAG
ncbi:cytochrome P450 [Streptomyces avicenniae]|uniref:cytochrome P450 n=1 Tax=Streptomyces avicenniae TaxID=500153 RepID=UPI00069AD9C9|nr:cytochrome P450 [Streptomyces avicenniae]